MNSHLRNFMALSGLAAANIYLTDRRPAWIWAGDGKTILWANAAGAAFFGAKTLADLADVYGLARAPARPHIARIAATGPADRDSIDRLRFYRGLRVMLLTCTCRRISLPDGDSGALIIANDAPATNTSHAEDPAIALCSLLADGGHAAFLFAADGALRHTRGSLPAPTAAERTNLRRAGKHSPVVAPLTVDGALREAALLALDDGSELLLVETSPEATATAAADMPAPAPAAAPTTAQPAQGRREDTAASGPVAEAGQGIAPDSFPAPAALGDHADPETEDEHLEAEVPAGRLVEERPEDKPAVPTSGLFALASATRFISSAARDEESRTPAPTGAAQTAQPVSDMPLPLVAGDLPDMASVLADIAAQDAPEATEEGTGGERTGGEHLAAQAIAPEDLLEQAAPAEAPLTEVDRGADAQPVAGTGGAPAEPEDRAEPGLDALDPAGTPSASGFVFTPHPRPVRFAWKMDIDQRFTFLSPEFTDALGPEAADVLGLTWTEVSERFQLDPEGGIAAALTRRDTWSGRTVRWPVSGAALKVPVDMAALPAFDRHRVFEGFRGFGVCRTGEATRDPLAIGPGLRLRDIGPAGQPASSPQAEAPADEASADEVQAALAQAPVASAAPDAAAPVTLPVEPETPAEPETSAEPEPYAAAAAAPPAAATDAGAEEPAEKTAVEPAEPARRGGGAVVSGLSAMAALIAGRAKAARADRLAHEDADRLEASATAGDAPLADDEADTREAPAPEVAAPDMETAPLEDATTIPSPAEQAEASLPAPGEDLSASKEDDGARVENAGARAEDRGAIDLFSRTGITPPASVPDETAADLEAPQTTPATPSESASPARPSAEDGPTADTPASADPALDASRLSKPEREAFRKIAEALGASPETEEPVERPTRSTEPEVPAGSIVDLGRRIREAHVPSRAGASDSGETVDTPRAKKPASDRNGGGMPAGAASTGLLDRLPVGVGIIDGDDVGYANTTLLDLLGYPDLAALRAAGGLSAVFAEPEDWPGSPPGSMTEQTMRICLASGGTKPVKARLHSVPWQDGKALMVSLLDRHDPAQEAALDRLHEVQTALNIAEEHLSEMDAVLETATDGVLLLNEEGRILKVNRSAEALFGASRDEMIGAALTGYLAPESHRDANDYLEGLARNGVASVLNDGREVIGQVRSGGLIPLFMTIGRVGSNAEGPRFCTVLRDITQWKTAEEELTDAKRQAENASSQKSDFLAKISHEIRTPLNAIIGFSEVMMEERFGPIGNDRYKGYLRDIHNSGSHIMSLINDLLDLSKIEAGKLDLTFEAVSANDIIRECVALMQPQANRERVIIRASLPGSVPSIVADGRSVRQIILNLLSNAIKFNQPGGQVIVSTALEDSGEVILRVRDTGMGMSAKDLGAAMEPFRQLHTARHGGGTGLGLPLTKALVEANRASFRIDSELHQGTLVEITFPPQRVLAE